MLCFRIGRGSFQNFKTSNPMWPGVLPHEGGDKAGGINSWSFKPSAASIASCSWYLNASDKRIFTLFFLEFFSSTE